MTTVLEQLLTHSDEIRGRGRTLAAQLREASRHLAESGHPVPRETVDLMRGFRAEFDRLQSDVIRETALSGSSPTPRSVTEIEDELQLAAQRREAVVLLDALSAIRILEAGDVAAWQRCLDEGRSARGDLSSPERSRSTAARIMSPDHPLHAVVTLATEGPRLADERWWTLQRIVEGAYGRPLVTTIIRGRVLAASQNHSTLNRSSIR